MPDSRPLTPQERRLRVALVVLALISVAFAVDYVVLGVGGVSEYPFFANSVAKDALFAVLAVMAAREVRRLSWLVVLLIVAHAVLVAALATSLIVGNVHHTGATLGASALSPEGTVWVWLGADVLIVVLFTWLYESAQRARWGLRYLDSPEYGVLMAMSEILVLHDNDVLSPEQVATNVDEYLDGFHAAGKWKIRLGLFALAIYPLLFLHPPLSLMSRATRRAFVERRFLREVWSRRLPGFLRDTAQSIIRLAQQMTFLGFYGDERGAATAGYARFSKRDGYAEAMKRVDPDRPRVHCEGPGDVFGDTITADVLIVGSGAAGSILAYELASRGRHVLVLERGRHVDPSEFTEHEPTQLSMLYADGALTLSKDFRFQVAQGMCVGGSTVVNNAVCFDIPPDALRSWNDPDGLNAGLDGGRLQRAFQQLRGFLPVLEQPTNGTPNPNGTLNPSWPLIQRGVDALRRRGAPYEMRVVEADVRDCLASGYCNIGCAWGKKLSMLDNVLPRAQAEFGREAVRVLAECYVERLEAGSRRATAAVCKLGDGRRISVRADTVVVSAGAIASSTLLARSDLGGANVGSNLGFNIASPLTGDFPEVVHAERGLQISHCVFPAPGERYVLETWFNPAGAQSLFMPGWFDVHRSNMKRYPHMACLGAVVGTKRNATVAPARFGREVKLTYTPAPEDFERLVAGLQTAGRIMLAAGAERVMPASFRFLEFKSEAGLAQLPNLVADNSDLQVNTSHPQGGNAMSVDRERGVVDPSFRVHGYDNLFVCDASVFPAPITVNPQLTVMALARYAADEIQPGRTPQAGDRTVQAGIPGSGR